MGIENPTVGWEKFRVGVAAENADRLLGTANRNWEQRNDNQLRKTSGVLKIGTKYRLQNQISTDDFLNVGSKNIDGDVFTATKDSVGGRSDAQPTVWTNSSVIEEFGTERFREIPRHWVNLYLAFALAHATTPDNTTASVFIYLYKEQGPAQYVGDYDLVAGDMDMVQYPYSPYEEVLLKNWVNTITINGTSEWIQTPGLIANAAATESVAMIRIPTFGARGILVEVDVVGSGVTCDVLITGSPQALVT